jgi:hypothetical protein
LRPVQQGCVAPPQEAHCPPPQTKPAPQSPPKPPPPPQHGSPEPPHALQMPFTLRVKGAVQPTPFGQRGSPSLPHAPAWQPLEVQAPPPPGHIAPDAVQVPEF